MSDSQIYACHRCGAFDIKLWRQYSTFDITLTCLDCLSVMHLGTDYEFDIKAIHPDASHCYLPQVSDPTWGSCGWEYGWWIPAVRVQDGEEVAYWGYTSVTPADWDLWLELPLRMEDA